MSSFSDEECFGKARAKCVASSQLTMPLPCLGLASALSTQNITCIDTEIRYCDGDGLVVRNSQGVNIDAGDYDE